MKKGEITRKHIIERAALVFNQRGFAGCSMQNLMEATGLEKGGLYRHFTSKEELAEEAFKYALQRILEARTPAGKADGGAIARLQSVVQRFVQMPSPIPGGCPLINASAEADTSSKAIRVLAREAMHLWKAEISKILEEGIRSRELRRDVEVRKTANAVISLLEGSTVISRLEGTREAMIDAQHSIESILMTLAQ